MTGEVREGGFDLLTGVLGGGFFIAYTLFAHHASAEPEISSWALLLAGAPMAVVGYGIARRNLTGLALWLSGAACLGALALAWPHLQHQVRWLYFLQHLGINLLLGLLFGRSLLQARRPLCTVFAELVHERMTPAVIRYTRQVTVAWTLFFLAMAAISVLLFFLAPIEAWSLFVNILTLPLVALMFIVENEARKRILPPEDNVGIFAAVRAFRATLRS
jgi:uncharacterized membrane protein